MRLLDRYIGREVASHAILGLAVFTFVFFVPQLVRLMDLSSATPAASARIALLFLCTLPPVLIFTIPMAVLVGVLIGLGRLSPTAKSLRSMPPASACGAAGSHRLRRRSERRCTLLDHFLAQPRVAAYTTSPGSDKSLASQAPFSVQPRVFDERFPHFVLYVQDAEAAATHWRGVFLALHRRQRKASAVTVAKDARSSAATQDTRRTPPGRRQHARIRSALSRSLQRHHVRRKRSCPSTFPAALPRRENSPLTVRRAPRFSASRRQAPTGATPASNSRIASRFPPPALFLRLLGVPIGVRPRRGGRAAGLILTLVLIGGYYFLFVAGDHMAEQGQLSPWVRRMGGEYRRSWRRVYFFRRIETIRKPNRLARVA